REYNRLQWHILPAVHIAQPETTSNPRGPRIYTARHGPRLADIPSFSGARANSDPASKPVPKPLGVVDRGQRSIHSRHRCRSWHATRTARVLRHTSICLAGHVESCGTPAPLSVYT